MAPITLPFHPGHAYATPPATSSAAAATEDAAFILTPGKSSYPLIDMGIAAWIVVCVVVICIWIERAKHGRAGQDLEDDGEKGPGRVQLSSFMKSVLRRDGKGSYDRGRPTSGLKLDGAMFAKPQYAPPLTPKPAYTPLPCLLHLSPPPAPTAALSTPFATPSFSGHGNACAAGAHFWAPSWALKAAEANAKARAQTEAPRLPSLSPTMGSFSVSGMFSPASAYAQRSPSLRSPSPSPSSNRRTTPSTRKWTTPNSCAIDFPEVPASIVARIRREPLPMLV
ncbi:uncharacterized protein B0H18DRAFT_1118760 [Fomitopsis serialis]|uniref:uncharacterized protein n=1 Tax=Fomitopsis serialis TaxID=139415 RepID=UPI0020080717|nr:uncharacterized protein B0H18DRAFT_1118760 [Neoantrodia serialis]KAH9926681.1 hypothetical protein B0H18DRAFT_1118760 [Neoantrodia serialis]